MTGQEVQALRKSLKLNQTAFWRRVHVTQSGGSRYEAGRNIPQSMQVLLTLAYGSEKDAAAMFEQLRR